MAFDARAEAANLAPTDDFEFTGLDGETYQLPPMGSLTGAQALRFEDGDISVLEEIAGEATAAAVMDLPLALHQRLAEEWLAHDENLGKASSPSRPTRRAAARSGRTSRSKAST